MPKSNSVRGKAARQTRNKPKRSAGIPANDTGRNTARKWRRLNQSFVRMGGDMQGQRGRPAGRSNGQTQSGTES